MPGEKQDFSKLTEDFVYGSLALSPVSATAAGYHEHRGVKLDERLDDYSQAGIREAVRFFRDFRRRLQSIQPESLSPEERADRQIMADQVELQLLEFDRIQAYRHNPTVYVELIGNALFTPSVLEYAPKVERFRQIVKRLGAVPVLLEEARSNLMDAPEVWNRVAREENDGNINLIDQLGKAAPEEVKADYDKAAKPAQEALRKFSDFLKDDLSKHTSAWRLGKEKYDAKFQYTLEAGKTPDEVLKEAEAALASVQGEMAKLAAPLSIQEALNRVAAQHATPETYLDAARQTLAEATEFVKAKHLVPLPPSSNLQVIPTPEFMRGIYAVGGFNQAPALEPQLGAFYWVTPIPPDWPKERIESKLREYNTYGMQELTIHEAMPGHYVQFEYANEVQSKPRRLLRSVFSNGPYVEGWAVYTQQMMSDEGYLNDSKELRLTFLKQMLRVMTNTILDVRLQTLDMTEAEALELMEKQAYQEKEEATAKLQRAQLSSCQLPTYFVGWRGWLDVRETEQKRLGAAFKLESFHERALKESAVPLPLLEKLLAQ
jgi:uncharacterized protein (DUF885 family)